MSVIVRGIEMPKNCALCNFRNAGETWCPFTLQGVRGNTIPEDCPLVPVPPHGRLIEADALTRAQGIHDFKYENGLMYVELGEVVSLIKAAPTIIPADKEEEHG